MAVSSLLTLHILSSTQNDSFKFRIKNNLWNIELFITEAINFFNLRTISYPNKGNGIFYINSVILKVTKLNSHWLPGWLEYLISHAFFAESCQDGVTSMNEITIRLGIKCHIFKYYGLNICLIVFYSAKLLVK